MYDIETPGVTLQLGKQGEGLVKTIDFDITGATGTPTLVHKRSEGDEPYFGITEVSGTTLTWTITKYDTALGGYGVAEIRFDNDDATAKSVLFKTYTIPSISTTTPSGQPEVPDWVQRIIDKVDEIKGMFPEAGTPGYFLRKTVTGMEWADGKGDRGDPGIPGTVISETAPEEEVLWIDPAAAELIQVPEVKDDTINTTDTWSSSKIDDMLTEQSDKITDVTIQLIAETKRLASFSQLKNLLPESESNTALRDAIIGCEIPDTWVSENSDGTDGAEYDDPMIVVSLENIEGADGETHWGAYVQRKWAALNAIPFDAREEEEAKEATEATAQEGLYYYGQTGDVLEQSALTLLTLTAGQTIPYGDYTKIYHNEIRDTTRRIVSNGYNNWRKSAYRQYLNSSAGVNAWWTATHVGDVEPTQLSTVRGYMAGCSAALLAAAKPCKVSCNTNTVTDGGVVETVVDTFWLPSVTQMYGVGNSDEGVYWPYWKRATDLDNPDDAANDGRKIYAIESHTTAQLYMLRSALRTDTSRAKTVTAVGAINNINSLGDSRATPCCAIW